jgi:hypothetical protein
MRPGQATGRRTALWWFASVCFLAAGGCLGSDLPSVVSRGSADAAVQGPPPLGLSLGDDATTLEAVDASPPPVSDSGQISLTIGLPIDTSTGQVVSLGPLTIRLRSEGGAPRSLTLQLSRPSGQVNLSLYDIAAGGPYTLDVIAAPNGGLACAGSSPPFFVAALETVRVVEVLLCNADAGFASTL